MCEIFAKCLGDWPKMKPATSMCGKTDPLLGLFTVLIVIFRLPIIGNAENLAKPMSDMEPDQFTGWWYAWKRTGALWESPHCARMLFESKGGDRYRISLTWINSESKPGTQIMEIIDDRSVKAKFLFANDAHTVALTILDTDYENYVVLRVRLGSKDVYYYGGRSVDHVEKYDSRADEIFKNNKVTYSLHAVNQTNCPNEQKFYLP